VGHQQVDFDGHCQCAYLFGSFPEPGLILPEGESGVPHGLFQQGLIAELGWVDADVAVRGVRRAADRGVLGAQVDRLGAHHCQSFQVLFEGGQRVQQNCACGYVEFVLVHACWCL
jgi:hypothetical protein